MRKALVAILLAKIALTLAFCATGKIIHSGLVAFDYCWIAFVFYHLGKRA